MFFIERMVHPKMAANAVEGMCYKVPSEKELYQQSKHSAAYSVFICPVLATHPLLPRMSERALL
jgi:hypothetical protein